jgi:integrase
MLLHSIRKVCRGILHGPDTATAAAMAGASERAIMKQTGHRSVQMVRRYIRDASMFRKNSAGRLGL